MYGQKQVSISQFFETPVDYQQLIRGYFGLNYLEFTVLSALNQLGEADTDEIRAHTNNGWSRNKINAALKNLTDLELCTRTKVSPRNQRGYKYVYQSIDVSTIRDRMLAAFEEFIVAAKQELENLDYHLNAVDTKAYQKKKSKKEKIRREWFEES